MEPAGKQPTLSWSFNSWSLLAALPMTLLLVIPPPLPHTFVLPKSHSQPPPVLSSIFMLPLRLAGERAGSEAQSGNLWPSKQGCVDEGQGTPGDNVCLAVVW